MNCWRTAFIGTSWPACIFLALSSAILCGAEVATIETSFIRLTVDPATGYCEVLDKEAGVTWQPDPHQTRFGELTVDARRDSQTFNLTRCTARTEGADL